jgi:hypothetical protein
MSNTGIYRTLRIGNQVGAGKAEEGEGGSAGAG